MKVVIQLVELNEKEFQLFTELVYKQFGLFIKNEKKSLVSGRLQQILVDHKFNSFSAFYNQLLSDKSGQLVTELLNRITTNHTYFMREVEHFDYFKQVVLPFLEKHSMDRDLRIWSAGCSSGEEPYTLAMIINDYFSNNINDWNTQLLATDISKNVLEKAKLGQYAIEKLDVLPKFWKIHYFEKRTSQMMEVRDEIKKQVIFRQFNLIQEYFPFKKRFQVIFCRNVMIYFDDETRQKLIQKFYDHMDDGGYLFIGQSESITRGESPFRYVMPSVYRKV